MVFLENLFLGLGSGYELGERILNLFDPLINYANQGLKWRVATIPLVAECSNHCFAAHSDASISIKTYVERRYAPQNFFVKSLLPMEMTLCAIFNP